MEKVTLKQLIFASLNLFNKTPSNESLCLVTEDNDFTTWENVFTSGIIMSPKLINEYVVDYIRENIMFDANATFYNSFDEVISKRRLELFIDQILHYATTYGTDYTEEPFIVKDINIEFDITKHIIFSEITREELIEKCLNMLSANIGLKEETLRDIFNILTYYDAIPADNSNINNREAKIMYYILTDTKPSKAEDIIRYVHFLTTKNTMIVKNDLLFLQLKHSNFDCSELFENSDLKEHAKIFNRYKKVYLGIKHANENNKKYINKISKLSKKYHEPKGKPWIETILDSVDVFNELHDKLPNMSNFKKIQLIETIRRRRLQLPISMYVIRNQKVFVKNETPKYEEWYSVLEDILYSSLIESLKLKNDKTIKLNDIVDITLPTSEKSFIGNYPIGSKVNFNDDDVIVGINWRGEDGAQDLDLSYIDRKGNKIGWNSSYYDDEKNIIYSGDMTSANPEATECLYASNGFNDGIVNVNIYGSRNGNIPFKLFLAKEKPSNFKRNYMVNPNNILEVFNLELDIRQAVVGVLYNNSFILAKLNSGNGWVSNGMGNPDIMKFIIENDSCKLTLEEVLTDAEFSFVENNADIDFSNVDKSTLLELFK